MLGNHVAALAAAPPHGTLRLASLLVLASSTDWAAVGAVAETVAAIALSVTVFFVLKQTKELVQQSRAANKRAAFETAQAATRDLDAVLAVLVREPKLWPYFFKDASAPTSPACLSTVTALAVWMLDALAGGVHAGEFDPDESSAMTLYAKDVLESSPVMRDLLERHQDWWTRLQPLAGARPPVADSSPPIRPGGELAPDGLPVTDL